MLESVMEELIAKYPMDFFPRKTLILTGRQGSFSGVGRFDLLFTDEHQTNILMELKARPAKYEDASQLAKYKDALKQQGSSNILMWLVATDIPNSIREFLDRIGIEYTEIHESEYRQIAVKHNEIVDKPDESIISEPIMFRQNESRIANRTPSIVSRSSFRPRSNISQKFRSSSERLRTFFPVALQFLNYIVSNSSEGFWLSTSTNAHLYYQDSFLAYIKLSLDSILFSPFFNGQIDGSTVDRHNLIFPEVFRRLTKDADGKMVSWARFNGDIVTITKQAPPEFFAKLLDEIKQLHKNTNAV